MRENRKSALFMAGLPEAALQDAVAAIAGFPHMTQFVAYRMWQQAENGQELVLDAAHRGIAAAQKDFSNEDNKAV